MGELVEQPPLGVDRIVPGRGVRAAQPARERAVLRARGDLREVADGIAARDPEARVRRLGPVDLEELAARAGEPPRQVHAPVDLDRARDAQHAPDRGVDEDDAGHRLGRPEGAREQQARDLPCRPLAARGERVVALQFEGPGARVDVAGEARGDLVGVVDAGAVGPPLRRQPLAVEQAVPDAQHRGEERRERAVDGQRVGAETAQSDALGGDRHRPLEPGAGDARCRSGTRGGRALAPPAGPPP